MAQRLTFISLVLLVAQQAAASAVSTSVFPNSACAGAKAGLVGIGKVTLSNGQVETHCGCPSDNLPSFVACPASSSGESVCNSILNLESGTFSASCGVVACSGTACPSTVVNTVVVDDDDCFTNGKGALGFTTVDGESKCACASESVEFTECPRPAGGRATCISTDSDFLGMAYTHKETVKCGVTCDEGFFLTAAGSCAKLTKRGADGYHNKRQGPSGASRGPSASATWTQTVTGTASGPSATYTFTSTITRTGRVGPSASAKYKAKRQGPSVGPSKGPSATYTATATATVTMGASQYHAMQGSGSGSSSAPSSSARTVDTRTMAWFPVPSTYNFANPGSPLPTPSTAYGASQSASRTSGASQSAGASQRPGASQRARRAADEFVFTPDVCAAGERSCPAGDFGEFSCVRLDDVTECGGCSSTGDAQNCLEIPGIASAVCLRGGCVVRSCQPGFVQTASGECSPKIKA